jgi:hypothetical protein
MALVHTNEEHGSIRAIFDIEKIKNLPLEEIATIWNLAKNEIEQKRAVADRMKPYRKYMDQSCEQLDYLAKQLQFIRDELDSHNSN